MRHGDGFEGWPPFAPFDGIIVAAASYQVPPALLDQLANGGRLIIPVGPDREQQLLRITRRGEKFEREVLGPGDVRAAVAGTGLSGRRLERELSVACASAKRSALRPRSDLLRRARYRCDTRRACP